MKRQLNNKEILIYQNQVSRQLKLDLYGAWLHNQCFNLKKLYVQWLLLAYTEGLSLPRVRKHPSPIDLELYDASTNRHICHRLGILRK